MATRGVQLGCGAGRGRGKSGLTAPRHSRVARPPIGLATFPPPLPWPGSRRGSPRSDPRETSQRQSAGQERRPRRSQRIRIGLAVCWLLAANVGSFPNNSGPGPPLIATNLGRKSRCLQVGLRMFAGVDRYSGRRSGFQPLRSARMAFLRAPPLRGGRIDDRGLFAGRYS
jgi:hypothetical protein